MSRSPGTTCPTSPPPDRTAAQRDIRTDVENDRTTSIWKSVRSAAPPAGAIARAPVSDGPPMSHHRATWARPHRSKRGPGTYRLQASHRSLQRSRPPCQQTAHNLVGVAHNSQILDMSDPPGRSTLTGRPTGTDVAHRLPDDQARQLLDRTDKPEQRAPIADKPPTPATQPTTMSTNEELSRPVDEDHYAALLTV